MNRTPASYLEKNIVGSEFIKDVDTESGAVLGYASVFSNEDSDGDTMQLGCYAKTLQERGISGKNRIKMYYNHNMDYLMGRPTRLEEDSKGLYHETPIVPTEQLLGKDIIMLVRDGVLDEFSVGFRPVKYAVREDDRGRLLGFDFTEVMLLEYSIVTLAANDLAQVTGAKSMSPNDHINELVERYQKINKQLRRGNYADETYEILEAKADSLFQYITDLKLQSLSGSKPQPNATVDQPGSRASTSTKNEPKASDDDTLLISQFLEKWQKQLNS